jgi:hypothetical protein
MVVVAVVVSYLCYNPQKYLHSHIYDGGSGGRRIFMVVVVVVVVYL